MNTSSTPVFYNKHFKYAHSEIYIYREREKEKERVLFFLNVKIKVVKSGTNQEIILIQYKGMHMEKKKKKVPKRFVFPDSVT